MLGADVQQLLGKDEALLTFIRSWKGDKTHVFVVRSDGLRAYTVPASLEEIKDAVAELRAGLDMLEGRLQRLPLEVGETRVDLLLRLGERRRLHAVLGHGDDVEDVDRADRPQPTEVVVA